MIIKGVIAMIYCVSDIHGQYEKYIKLLEVINFNKNDILYVLGDIVDRGHGSIKILKDMMNRSNVFGIFGNHELMCIECLEWLSEEINYKLLENFDEDMLLKLNDWINNGAYFTIQELKKLNNSEKQDIINYLMEFTAYEELLVNGKEFLLVHAGLGNFSKEKNLDEYDVNDFVWERPDWDIPYFDETNKYVIVGHTPTLSITGKAEIFHKNNFIVIDCGTCFEGGELACLCLDTMEEFYV